MEPLHDGLVISLTREQFNNKDMKNVHRMSTPSHIEPHTPMNTFTGHTNSGATSKSQTALSNFERVQKEIHQIIPSSRMIFTMIDF